MLSPAPTPDAHDVQYEEAGQAGKELGVTLRSYRISATAERGGLIAYAMDNVAMFKLTATYVDKILEGAKPGDLPLTRWTRDNVRHINVPAAEAIGLTLPPSLVARAARTIR